MRIFSMIFVVGLIGSANGQETASFSSKPAQQAQQKFQHALKTLEKQRQQAVAGHVEDYKQELREAGKLAFEQGNIAEAQLILNELKQLKDDPTEVGALVAENRRLQAKLAELTAPPQTTIPRDAVGFAGRRYLVVTEPMPHSLALKHCQAMGGTLARINSKAEQTFVARLVRRVNSVGVWIDGSDAAEEGQWRWSNGEPMKYFNWGMWKLSGEQEPKNRGGIEHCVAMVTDVGAESFKNDELESGSWADFPAGERFAFVCEWDQ